MTADTPAPPDSPVPLTASELQVIDQFRRQKSTAVLTILFTDIKGFTRMTEEHGEAYSNKLRKHHDELVVPVIERDGGGRVIKHIGDSVMAVFSEPSTAVARALEVQDALAQFGRAHPELEKIEVRMGLHSGQVTTEEGVSADVFGRHVNRAARVEALADGGQILVTYPVYDSARGWLNEHSDKPAAWEKHGRYALKGIPEPVEIFEVYDPKLTKAKAPPGGMKAGGLALPHLAGAALALIVLAVLGTYLFIRFAGSTPEVSLVDYNSDWAKLWDGQPFNVGGEPGQHIRPVLTPLKAGHYMLVADSSQIVRFYAPLDIKSGKNVIEARFDRTELPSMERRISYSTKEPNELHENTDEEYTSYDAQMQPHANKAHIDMDLKAEPDPDNAKKIKFTCTWTVTLNGNVITQGTVTDGHMTDDGDIQRVPEKVLWSDDYHYYYLSYYMSGGTIDVTLESNFADYKDRK
ncbi:MAG TPA: adenylate/guanylate cyclase domain-containing protein [Patescibacteria group bacterium]|nr:adenylate/guanylate cyclase domain-containing protein [Patescibacteria group bacterium]